MVDEDVKRGWWLGFALALVVSGGVVLERVSAGDGVIALALAGVTLAVTALVAVRTHALSALGSQPAIALAQVAGLVVGVLAVHVPVAAASPAGAPLREGPAQLVNDGMLGVGLLLLVWSFVARSGAARLVAPVVAFGLLLGYRATAGFWHLDALAFPRLTVQQFVQAQVVAVSAGLLVLHWLRPPTAR
ncbi:MAG: hypothetical protein KC635_20465 [Myxococcales bacterium]|nr:hypothetical protein [Myxococcales bacterium]